MPFTADLHSNAFDPNAQCFMTVTHELIVVIVQNEFAYVTQSDVQLENSLTPGKVEQHRSAMHKFFLLIRTLTQL